jgi:predicted transcriptional regulator of viral defense system
MNEVVTGIDILRDIALDQYGYVTMAQAIGAGLSKSAVLMMAHRGRIDRIAHGVYRVPQVPATKYDRYMLAVLWTGAPEACLGYDTALEAYDVSDINPVSIHVIVARKRRIAKVGGEHYIIHRKDLEFGQTAWWEGIPIVTLPVAIEQCIRSGVPTYLIRQALERAPQTGALLPEDITRLTKLLEERVGACQQ